MRIIKIVNKMSMPDNFKRETSQMTMKMNRTQLINEIALSQLQNMEMPIQKKSSPTISENNPVNKRWIT